MPQGDHTGCGDRHFSGGLYVRGMPAPTIESVPQAKIAEVKAFLKAKDAYDEWKALFAVPVRKLREIAGLYNPLLVNAEKAVRAAGVSCPPCFELFSHTPKFDAEVLYKSVGRQKFAALGGVLEPSEIRTIDRSRFLALVAMEKIDPELVDQVLTYGPRYHTPDPIVLP